jgi:NADH-quinone oxidoreductase subunit M
MGNIGLPGTSSFIGEFLVIMGSFETNSWTALLCGPGLVLGAAYSLWLQNRMLFGNIKNYSISSFRDLTRFEFNMLLPFMLLTIILGLYPEIITSYLSIF